MKRRISISCTSGRTTMRSAWPRRSALHWISQTSSADHDNPQGEPPRMNTTSQNPHPIRELVWYFLRLGTLGFGGPVALVGQMERELVGERRWLTKDQMREVIAVCQSLPGPLAIQVGI